MSTDTDADECAAYFDVRWDVPPARIKRWWRDRDPQLLVGQAGKRYRYADLDLARRPITCGIAAYAAARGVTVAQLEARTGLTRRTLNRLALSNNTHRVRDLVAGVAVLLAAEGRRE